MLWLQREITQDILAENAEVLMDYLTLGYVSKLKENRPNLENYLQLRSRKRAVIKFLRLTKTRD